jgi:hypothetical protein
MEDLLLAALFFVCLVTSPHPIIFVIGSICIFFSLGMRLFFITQLPHKKGKKYL